MLIRAMTQTSPGSYMSYWDRCEKINEAVNESAKKTAYDKLLGKCEELIQVPGNAPTCKSPFYDLSTPIHQACRRLRTATEPM